MSVQVCSGTPGKQGIISQRCVQTLEVLLQGADVVARGRCCCKVLMLLQGADVVARC